MKYFVNASIGHFLRREKRFFAYMEDGRIAYCPNPGKMADILVAGAPCILVPQQDTSLSYRWEAIQIDEEWIGVNTHTPNGLVALLLPTLFPDQKWRAEVRFGSFRADFASEEMIVEVKHVHWKRGEGAYFPDCVTARGKRQLTALASLTQKYRCVLIYVVQRQDVSYVATCPSTDPEYAAAYELARRNGMEVLAFRCHITPQSIALGTALPVQDYFAHKS